MKNSSDSRARVYSPSTDCDARDAPSRTNGSGAAVATDDSSNTTVALACTRTYSDE